MGRKRKDLFEIDSTEDSLTPGHFAQRQKAISDEPPRKRILAPGTEKLDRILWRLWQEFCNFRGSGGELGWEDAEAVFLSEVSDVHVAFFDWYIPVKTQCSIRQISIQNMGNTLLRVFRSKNRGVKMAPEEASKIRDALCEEGWLVEEYDLSLEEKEKPTIYFDKFWKLLSCLWWSQECSFAVERLRAQFHLYLLLTAYTASRPGAILGHRDKKGNMVKYLTFTDCQFIKYRNPDDNEQPLITLEVDLKWTKNRKGEKKANKFTFHQHPQLALCPVTMLLTCAIADGALDLPDSISDFAEAFYEVKILDGKDKAKIPWKASWLNQPLFRGIEWTGSGYQMSSQPLAHRTLLKFFARICKAACWEEVLTTYALRRSAGTMLDQNTTTAIRNQVMGHAHAAIFEKHYLDRRVQCDTQNAFLGIPSDAAILYVASRISTSTDSRIPKRLDAADWRQIREQSPKLTHIEEMVKKFSDQCVWGSGGSMKNAELKAGTVFNQEANPEAARDEVAKKLRGMSDSGLRDCPTGPLRHFMLPFALLKEARRRRKNLRSCLEREFLERKRDNFLKITPADDIRRQFADLPPNLPPAIPQVQSGHDRAHLAAQLFCADVPQPASREDIKRRCHFINKLVAHLPRQEPRRRLAGPNREKAVSVINVANTRTDTAELSSKADAASVVPYTGAAARTLERIPLCLPRLTCIFCLFDPGNEGCRWSSSTFLRKDVLKQHAQRRHFKYVVIPKCPHDQCKGQTFMHLDALKAHIIILHGIYY